MKRLYINTFILISFLCIIGCTNKNEFKNIETFINERPDSALMVLQSIDVSSLKGDSINHYQLLLAQAKDKCFIDETDDSLMVSVVRYYKRRNDFSKLFRSYYYLGRIQQNDHRYLDAMYSYMAAEQLLDYIEDDFSKGLLYAQIGSLYYSNLDFVKALNAFELADGYYHKAGKVAYENFAKLDIGNVCYRLKRYSESEKYLGEVLSWALDNEDYLLCKDVTELLCLVYEANNDVESLRNLMNQIPNEETLILNRA
ncbi:MAG: hypothetical protein ACI3ZN_08480, partial [Candidatus Cryptobacteroides sp.]